MNWRPNVLIIDDDGIRRRRLHREMLESGFSVADADHPEEAIALSQVLKVHLAILDTTPQDHAGKTIHALRIGIPQAAIVVLTNYDDPNRIADLMEAGADQCLSRPLHLPEFLAFVSAALRPIWSLKRIAHDSITIGEITLEPSRRRVYRSGTEVHLTPKEFDLLHHLMAHAGLPITHESLLKAGWGTEDFGRLEYLRIVMRQLRTKLNDHLDPRYILTDYCVGYRFAEPNGFLFPAGRAIQETAVAAS